MKYSILIFLLLVSADIGTAQSTLSASGGGGTVGSITVSYTVGEAFITTIEGSTIRLSQGFHQPRYTVTALKETFLAGQVKVFPNLTSSFLQVEFKDVTLENLDISLFDLAGRCILVAKPDRISWQTDMTNLHNGYYLLTVSDRTNAQSNSFKIVKSN